MIVDSPLDIVVPDMFLRLDGFHGGVDLYCKIEGLNPAGSIKMKPAVRMVADLERRGLLTRGRNRIIESSSGNLGIALSIVCLTRGYHFICVTDPNTPHVSTALMAAYGAEVVTVDAPDSSGGFLGSRISYIRERLRHDPSLIWTNQYANPVNTLAHYRTTAPEIARQFPHLDALFVGAGTTGTLTGCARYFARHRPEVRIVAVDAAGSVTFGGAPAKRYIPGLGTSRRPEIATLDGVHDLVVVDEVDTIEMAQHVRDCYGLLVGGSTATVLAAIKQSGAPQLQGPSHRPATIVAISADLGDRYAATVYDSAWAATRGISRSASVDTDASLVGA